MENHFENESWADYVRGDSSVADATAMRQHIGNDCKTCIELFRIWRTVAEIAARELSIEVPEHIRAATETTYTAWWRRTIPKRARMARLIFDSLRQPLPSGVRGTSAWPHRVIAARRPVADSPGL